MGLLMVGMYVFCGELRKEEICVVRYDGLVICSRKFFKCIKCFLGEWC